MDNSLLGANKGDHLKDLYRVFPYKPLFLKPQPLEINLVVEPNKDIPSIKMAYWKEVLDFFWIGVFRKTRMPIGIQKSGRMDFPSRPNIFLSFQNWEENVEKKANFVVGS